MKKRIFYLLLILLLTAGVIFAEQLKITAFVSPVTGPILKAPKGGLGGDTAYNTYDTNASASASSMIVQDKVGIGTTAPSQELDIDSTSRDPVGGVLSIYGSDTIRRIVTGLGGTYALSYPYILFLGNDSGVGAPWRIYPNMSGNSLYIYGSTGGGGSPVLCIDNYTSGGTTYKGIAINGTSTWGYALYVASGYVFCDTDNLWNASDLRYKKNIENLTGVTKKLENINGVKFDWRADEFPEKKLSRDRQIGIIAQNAEKEFPELVNTGTNGEKAFAYDKFNAVLLAAVKEQHKAIAEQEAEIATLKQEAAALKAALKKHG